MSGATSQGTITTFFAGSVHLYFHPEWPDIKLAQAALLCGQAADMITAEGLQVHDTPVMLGGDWNSLWRKYKPDVYDTHVSRTCLEWDVQCYLLRRRTLHNPSCCHTWFGYCAFSDCFSASLCRSITTAVSRRTHTFHDNVLPDCVTLRRFHQRVS